jgi:multidrug efflux pump subunit AcrB
MSKKIYSGTVSWMVKHSVTSNLLMFVLLLGGIAGSILIKKEVFPDFNLDKVEVVVEYPGASPEEVEKSIILVIEDSVEGLDGIDEIQSKASEGRGLVSIEMVKGYNLDKLAQDVNNEVDRITSFPEEAEKPQIYIVSKKRHVVSVLLYGGSNQILLREATEELRDALLNNEHITQVELAGAEEFEISIDISQDKLREYGVTYEEVANAIRKSSIELPAGGIKTKGGEILVRVEERKDYGNEFEKIPIITTPEGGIIRLENVATINDSFKETDCYATYDGKRAIKLDIYRVGDQTPLEVAGAVRSVLKKMQTIIPSEYKTTIVDDQSKVYEQRFNLMMKNGFYGLLLVIVLLGIFLEIRLAFWVTLGIPISFLGTMLFLPMLGLSLNIVSMFAFIISLGIVVDDAIVVGENVYKYHKRGLSFFDSAIQGTREVALPVVFSVLTNIVAFMPLAFVPGTMGKIFLIIPVVVISTFVISLIESLYVLPGHLAHESKFINFCAKNLKYFVFIPAVIYCVIDYVWGYKLIDQVYGIDKSIILSLLLVPSIISILLDFIFGLKRKDFGYFLHKFQQSFSEWFEQKVKQVYGPILNIALKYRYITLAISVVILILTIAYVKSGRLGLITFPKVEQDYALVTVAMPYGTPIKKVEEIRDKLEAGAEKAIEKNGGDDLGTGIFSWIGAPLQFSMGRDTGSHIIKTWVYLKEPDKRPITTDKFVKEWGKEVGELEGIDMIRYESDAGGPGSGSALTIELSHRNIEMLQDASTELGLALERYSNVKDIDTGFSPGKPQLSLVLTEFGKSMGLKARDLATQLRSTYYGYEVVRQQRERNEVKIMVRRLKSERDTEESIDNFIVRLTNGAEVPLEKVTKITRGRAYTTIARRNGRRAVTVTADVVPQRATERILKDVVKNIMPTLQEKYPGLTYSFEGKQANIRESLTGLFIGLLVAIVVIYSLLAIPLNSYTQPLIIMLSIPFGIVGAVYGHVVMNYPLCIISIFGIVALSGVVVNDSLVLIDFANKERANGVDKYHAVHSAGILRFRPIMLTTLSTFFGLTPMIFETSAQAKFLIPLALSLGFGILFATAITLIIVPSFYMVIEDVLDIFSTTED